MKRAVLRGFTLCLFLCIFFGCAAPRYKSIKELNGKIIGVPIGVVEDDILKAYFPDSQIIYYDNGIHAFDMLMENEVHALIAHKNDLRKYSNTDKSYRVLDEYIVAEKYAFALNKENSRLLNEVNNAIDEFRVAGVLENMLNRWFLVEGNVGPMPEIVLMESESTLRIGTCANIPPFSFVGADGKIKGLDIELVMRMSDTLNKNAEIIKMDFGSLIPAINRGEVDLIASGLKITDELSDKIVFSKPYYVSGICVVVKD